MRDRETGKSKGKDTWQKESFNVSAQSNGETFARRARLAQIPTAKPGQAMQPPLVSSIPSSNCLQALVLAVPAIKNLRR